MKRSAPIRRKSPLRAKRPNFGERITARAGLLWRNDAVIPLPEADTVARAHGFRCAEAMVRALRDGSFVIPLDRPQRKARPPLPKQSAKRKALNPVRPKRDPIYEKAVREWRAGHDGRCEMRYDAEGTHLPRVPDGFDPRKTIDPFRCSREANERPHHMKRRGKFKSDKSTFLGLCDSCHLFWLHHNEEDARRLGYLTDRPAKELKLKRLNPHPGNFQANGDLPGSF